jgi:hypothetical protein
LSTWRRKAIEAVPELKGKLEKVASQMEAWIEIRMYFEGIRVEEDRKIGHP